MTGLREYERLKFELAELIRSAQLLRGDDRGFRDLLIHLAEDRFTVVVAGRFSRGKSSLLNALFGQDRLPTGIVPITSVITYLRYGSSERVLIDYLGTMLRGEAKLSELASYVPATRPRSSPAAASLLVSGHARKERKFTERPLSALSLGAVLHARITKRCRGRAGAGPRR